MRKARRGNEAGTGEERERENIRTRMRERNRLTDSDLNCHFCYNPGFYAKISQLTTIND